MAGNSIHVRHFRRAAAQRFEDARILREVGRNTGAVYLAGYCVECTLKGLILTVVPARREREIMDSFRGTIAHNYDHLRHQLVSESGRQIERDIVQHLVRVNTWGTELRYLPGATRSEDADAFFESVEAIVQWAEGRW